MDFERWRSTNIGGTEVLWLSGPPKCRISDASSRIIDLAKESQLEDQHSVLYFFCSTAPANLPVAISFVSTVVRQLARFSPQLRRKIAATFLCTLFETILQREPLSDPEESRFSADVDDSAEVVVKKILKASSSDAYWSALRAVMDIERERGLSLIIDGLEKAEHQKYEFIREIHRFIEHLRERPSTTRVLLTSQPLAEIKGILGQLPCIEYDRERKGLIASFLILWAIG